MMDFMFIIYYYMAFIREVLLCSQIIIYTANLVMTSVCSMETVIKYAIAQKLDEICFYGTY